MIKEDIICAGFGGQGIMTLGKVLANAAMEAGLHVTWLSSYGAEVRGGTAHAMVRISSERIGNPGIYKPDTIIVLNSPSLDKFEEKIAENGLVIINNSMKSRDVGRKDVEVIEYPFTEQALNLGNARVANMIAAGMYDAKKKLFGKDILIKVMEKMAEGREDIIPINIRALKKGYQAGSEL